MHLELTHSATEEQVSELGEQQFDRYLCGVAYQDARRVSRHRRLPTRRGGRQGRVIRMRMRVSGEHHFGGLGKAALAHDFDESAKGSKIHEDSISEYSSVDKFIFVMPCCDLG